MASTFIILTFWLPIVLGIIVAKLMMFNTYNKNDEKFKLPIVLYIAFGVVMMIPILNIIALCVIISFIIVGIADEDLVIKHWLFKSI